MSLRAAFKAKGEALGMNNVTLNDMVLYAVAKTLRGHRDLNANYLDDQDIMRYFTHVNLGVAVDTPRGLLVPTVFSADTLSLNELSAQTKTLISDAKAGTISPDKLRGGSFTVTNLGLDGHRELYSRCQSAADRYPRRRNDHAQGKDGRRSGCFL